MHDKDCEIRPKKYSPVANCKLGVLSAQVGSYKLSAISCLSTDVCNPCQLRIVTNVQLYLGCYQNCSQKPSIKSMIEGENLFHDKKKNKS